MVLIESLKLRLKIDCLLGLRNGVAAFSSHDRYYRSPTNRKTLTPCGLYQIMLKITAVSAAQAKNYYAKDDYYTQGEAAKNESRWLGRGSQRLGLSGEVDKDDFQALLNGVTPQGELLQAKKITIAKHRAGYDLTFSADKSVSFAALVLGDERVITAHDQAVERAIAVAEARYAQARVWHRAEKRQSAIATGNVITAVFRHETSRNLDPQLHSHAVLLNGTQDQQDTWRALHVDGIFAEKKLVQMVYHNELAYRLRQSGYEVEASKEGSCKIKGFDDRSLAAFSSRRQQIEKYVAKQVATGAERSGALYQQAAIATRKRKQDTPHAALSVGWKSVAISARIELPELPQSQAVKPADISELVRDAITHTAERESVF